MLKNGNFVLLECFARKLESFYAICRFFKRAEEIDFGLQANVLSFSYAFKLEEAGNLIMISVDELQFKTIVLPEGSTYLVSVLKEGFEHN